MLEHGRVVRRVAGELLRRLPVEWASAKRLFVLWRLELTDDFGMRLVFDVDEPGPTPRTSGTWISVHSIDFVGREHEWPSRHFDCRVPVGTCVRAVRWCGRSIRRRQP